VASVVKVPRTGSDPPSRSDARRSGRSISTRKRDRRFHPGRRRLAHDRVQSDLDRGDLTENDESSWITSDITGAGARGAPRDHETSRRSRARTMARGAAGSLRHDRFGTTRGSTGRRWRSSASVRPSRPRRSGGGALEYDPRLRTGGVHEPFLDYPIAIVSWAAHERGNARSRAPSPHAEDAHDGASPTTRRSPRDRRIREAEARAAIAASGGTRFHPGPGVPCRPLAAAALPGGPGGSARVRLNVFKSKIHRCR